MSRAQQSIVNDRDVPIYISIEPAPECYELEPGESLTLIYDLLEGGDAFAMNVTGDGIVIWPLTSELEVLINGTSAGDRSWKFKHR